MHSVVGHKAEENGASKLNPTCSIGVRGFTAEPTASRLCPEICIGFACEGISSDGYGFPRSKATLYVPPAAIYVNGSDDIGYVADNNLRKQLLLSAVYVNSGCGDINGEFSR